MCVDRTSARNGSAPGATPTPRLPPPRARCPSRPRQSPNCRPSNLTPPLSETPTAPSRDPPRPQPHHHKEPTPRPPPPPAAPHGRTCSPSPKLPPTTRTCPPASASSGAATTTPATPSPSPRCSRARDANAPGAHRPSRRRPPSTSHPLSMSRSSHRSSRRPAQTLPWTSGTASPSLAEPLPVRRG